MVLGFGLGLWRLNAYHMAGLNPQDGWQVCGPGEDPSLIGCVEPSVVPPSWLLVLAGVLTAVGLLLLLARAVFLIGDLRAHARAVSDSST